MRVSVTHDLKIVEPHYSDLALGVKTFELRKNDRGFRVGDILLLRKWHLHEGYSGDMLRCTVSHVLEGPVYGLESGYVIMSLDLWSDDELHLPPPG